MVHAKDIEVGPAVVLLPHRICSGTHATWADGPTTRNYQEN
jgi:carotenoid cleavage dioxygenase-like enzyme